MGGRQSSLPSSKLYGPAVLSPARGATISLLISVKLGLAEIACTVARPIYGQGRVTQVPNPCAARHRRGLKFELASYELQGFQRS